MRNIFTYDLGEIKGSIDPLKALRLMWEFLPAYDEVVKNYNSAVESKDVKQAMGLQGQLIRAGREAFGLKEYDGSDGVIDSEVFEIIGQFNDWLEKKNASIDSQPT